MSEQQEWWMPELRLQGERLSSIHYANLGLQQLVTDQHLTPDERMHRIRGCVEDIALALKADEVGLAEIDAYRDDRYRDLGAAIEADQERRAARQARDRAAHPDGHDVTNASEASRSAAAHVDADEDGAEL